MCHSPDEVSPPTGCFVRDGEVPPEPSMTVGKRDTGSRDSLNWDDHLHELGDGLSTIQRQTAYRRVMRQLPLIVILYGPHCSGKSTLAAQFRPFRDFHAWEEAIASWMRNSNWYASRPAGERELVWLLASSAEMWRKGVPFWVTATSTPSVGTLWAKPELTARIRQVYVDAPLEVRKERLLKREPRLGRETARLFLNRNIRPGAHDFLTIDGSQPLADNVKLLANAVLAELDEGACGRCPKHPDAKPCVGSCALVARLISQAR